VTRSARLAIVLALTTLPGTARPAPSVLLLGDGVSPQIPAALREATLRAVTASLAQLRGVELRRPPEPSAELGARLDALLAAARASSERFEEREALVKLAEAEQAFRAAFGRVPSVEPLARVLLVRVRILAELQRDDDLRRDLARLLALDPGRTFDRAQFPPKLVATWRRLQAREGKRRSTLAIATEPAGLPVFVDGARRGTSPLELSLPPGEHFVAAGGSGASVILGKERAEVSLKPVPLPDESWLGEARRAGARFALLVELTPAAGGAYLLRLRLLPARGELAPRALSSRPVVASGLERAAAALCAQLPALLAGHARAARPSPPPTTAPPVDPGVQPWLVPRPRRTPVWKRWWFWTAIGVAVAGGVTGAVLLTRERETQIRLAVER
jgi:hypothetical protein